MLVLQSHIEFDGTSQSWIPSSDWGALGMQKVWESLSKRGYVMQVNPHDYALHTTGWAITEAGISAYLANGGTTKHPSGEDFLDDYRQRGGVK